MGTRCLTIIIDGVKKEEICVLYRQHDGYPDGHGAELRAFLQSIKIIDGFSNERSAANGAHCLAAQIVAHFKTGIGEFYLYPAGARDMGEEYVYTVTATVGLPVEIVTQGDD